MSYPAHSDEFHPYVESHVKPQGPGDARPTALQIVKDNDCLGKLNDKVVLVTGASSGIGIETARALHETGAKVFMGVRNVQKGSNVKKKILESSDNKAEVEVIELDLDSLDSVRKAAENVKSKTDKLNILVNNAGVMAIPTRTLTKDGFETQFQANYLGHFLLFLLLKPLLLTSATSTSNSRIINVSSLGHRTCPVQFNDMNLSSTYTPWTGYGHAKTASIWMSNYISRHFGGQNLQGLSLHPGGIATPLQKHMDPATIAKWGENEEVQKYMKNTEQGAATTVWAALGKVWEGKGGVYLEDCMVSPKKEEGQEAVSASLGYATWAYDEQGEDKLWDIASEMIGMKG